MRRPFSRRGAAAVLGAATLGTALLGTAATASAAGPHKSTHVTHAKLAKLQRAVHKAESIPPFVAPGPGFHAAKARGKSVVAVPSSSQIPYCQGIIDDMVKIGKPLGVKVTDYNSTGEVSQWEQAATLAAAQHAGVFTTICGINPASIAPQLRILKKKKVKTVALLGDVSLAAPPSVTAGASIQLAKAARLLVDDAVLSNKGKPFHALILTDYDIFGANAPTKAAERQLKSVCGSRCPFTVRSVPITSWASGIDSTVSSLLTRDQKITSIIALYDGMVPGMVSAVQNAHRPGLKVFTYGASSGVVKLIKSTHGTVAADIGASTPWTAYTQMDQVLRLLAGVRPVPTKDEYPPLRLWDLKNEHAFFSHDAYGKAFARDYKKLWHVG